MQLLINIPKEFEQHFKQDAFEDSLHRLSADAHLLAGLYEQETAKMLIDSFKNAVPVSPHGDLIDRNALLQRAIPHGWSTPKWVSDIVINDAPTIIEAEEGAND